MVIIKRIMKFQSNKLIIINGNNKIEINQSGKREARRNCTLPLNVCLI